MARGTTGKPLKRAHECGRAARAPLLAAVAVVLPLAGACHDKLAERRAALGRIELTVPPPQPPRPPTVDPALGDPWLDSRVLRKVPLPNLPYAAQLVGAECLEHPEEYALLTVLLLKDDSGETVQELSHYGSKQALPDGSFPPPDLEHYPNFNLTTTEVRDVNFDKQPDILIGDSYSKSGIGAYAVWIFDTRNGAYTNSILPRIGKFSLDAEHQEIVSKPWEPAQGDSEQIYSFARSPWVAESLPAAP